MLVTDDTLPIFSFVNDYSTVFHKNTVWLEYKHIQFLRERYFCFLKEDTYENMSLQEFLMTREVPEDTINYFVNEKVSELNSFISFTFSRIKPIWIIFIYLKMIVGSLKFNINICFFMFVSNFEIIIIVTLYK